MGPHGGRWVVAARPVLGADHAAGARVCAAGAFDGTCTRDRHEITMKQQLLWANEGVFMSWPRIFLQGPAAATGVALINSVGNCGGLVGPYVLSMGGFEQGMLILACIVLFNAVLAAAFPMPTRMDVPGVVPSAGSSITPLGPAAYKLLHVPGREHGALGKVVRQPN